MPERALALKRRLRDGGVAIGAFLTLADPAVVNALKEQYESVEG